jgi:putative FmdB family regulatory protein
MSGPRGLVFRLSFFRKSLREVFVPNYEYKCTQDGSRFEVWQEVGSEAPPCPTCGAPSKKVFSPPRVIFKGSGFYVTDLRAEKSGGKSESGDSSESASKTETKTESTPAPAASAPAASSGASSAKTD